MKRSDPWLFTALVLLVLLSAGSLLPEPARSAPLPALTQTGEPPTPTPTRRAERVTQVPQVADPAMTVEISNPQPQVGDEFVLTLRITNLGNRLAQGVIAEQSLPPYLQLVALATERGQVVSEGAAIGCWVGDVAPGEEILCTITVRMIAEPAAGSEWSFAQMRSSDAADPLDNNSATSGLTFAVAPTATTVLPAPLPAVLPNTADGPHLLILLLLLGALLLVHGLRLYHTDASSRR